MTTSNVENPNFVLELCRDAGLEKRFAHALMRSNIRTRAQVEQFLVSRGPHVRGVGLTGFVRIRHVYEKYTGNRVEVSRENLAR